MGDMSRVFRKVRVRVWIVIRLGVRIMIGLYLKNGSKKCCSVASIFMAISTGLSVCKIVVFR